MCSGWLQKEMKTNAKSTSLKLKKRWFVLTHNSLDYYKSSERNSSKMGTLVLNSLCSVIQPDERVHRETGEEREIKGMSWKITLNQELHMQDYVFLVHFDVRNAIWTLFKQATGTSSYMGGSILTGFTLRCWMKPWGGQLLSRES